MKRCGKLNKEEIRWPEFTFVKVVSEALWNTIGYGERGHATFPSRYTEVRMVPNYSRKWWEEANDVTMGDVFVYEDG